jgi:hypothetical protein
MTGPNDATRCLDSGLQLSGMFIFLYSQIYLIYNDTWQHTTAHIYDYDMPLTNDGDDCGMTRHNGKFFLSFVSITIRIYLFTFSFYKYDMSSTNDGTTNDGCRGLNDDTSSSCFFFVSIILIYLLYLFTRILSFRTASFSSEPLLNLPNGAVEHDSENCSNYAMCAVNSSHIVGQVNSQVNSKYIHHNICTDANFP